MSVASGFGIEAVAVVVHPEDEPAIVDRKVRFHGSAARVLDRVVHALLEDQIGLAALVGIDDNAVLRAGRSKVEFDVL